MPPAKGRKRSCSGVPSHCWAFLLVVHSAPEADSPSWWKYARSSGDIVDVHQHLSSLGSIGCQVSEGPAIASRKPWTLSRLKGLTLSCLFCFPLCCLFCLFYALFVITVATGSCLYSSEVSSCVLNGLQSLLASVLLLLALYLPPSFFSLSRWLLVHLFPAMIQFPPSCLRVTVGLRCPSIGIGTLCLSSASVLAFCVSSSSFALSTISGLEFLFGFRLTLCQFLVPLDLTLP